MSDTITATFGLDIGPLKKGFAQAEMVAQTGAAKVTATMNQQLAKANTQARTAVVNWQALADQRRAAVLATTARGPRTAANFAPAPPGKYQSPEDQESKSSQAINTGLRLMTIVYASVRAYEWLKESIDKTREATEKLHTGASRPLGIISQLTSSEIGKEIENREAELKEYQSQISTFAHAFTKTWGSIVMSTMPGVHKGVGEKNDEEQKAIEDRIKLIDDLSKLKGKTNLEMADIEQRKSFGDKGAAELEMIKKKGEAERAAINLLPKNFGTQNDLSASKMREGTATYESEKRVELAKAEVQLEGQLLNIGESNLTTDQKRADVIKERIYKLEAEKDIKGGDPIERGRIQNQIDAAKVVQRDQQIEEWQGGPARKQAQESAAAAKARLERNFKRSGGQQFPHFGMSGGLIANPAYLRSPDAYGGLLDPPVPQGGRDYQTPTFSSNLGATDQHMGSYGGSDSFKKFFYGGKDDHPPDKPKDEISNLTSEVKGLRSDFREFWGGN